MTPMSIMKTYEAWLDVATGMASLGMAAQEVVIRRSAMMASGAMMPQEAARMMMEKPTAFAESAQMAALALAGGKDPAAIASAALHPIRLAARANARRLRS